jgi:hypothetical protein
MRVFIQNCATPTPTRPPTSAPTNPGDTNAPTAAPILYHNWTSPVPDCTYTDANDYDTTAATNDGGVFPFKSSDTLACRVWKLAATICNSPPVDYQSNTYRWGRNSWNFFCESSGGFTDPRFGTFCPVTNQYACTVATGLPSRRCLVRDWRACACSAHSTAASAEICTDRRYGMHRNLHCRHMRQRTRILARLRSV